MHFVSCLVLCSVVLQYIVICTGMNKVDEKLKVCRTKRPEGAPFNEESKKKQLTPITAKRELPCHSQGEQISPTISLGY